MKWEYFLLENWASLAGSVMSQNWIGDEYVEKRTSKRKWFRIIEIIVASPRIYVCTTYKIDICCVWMSVSTFYLYILFGVYQLASCIFCYCYCCCSAYHIQQYIVAVELHRFNEYISWQVWSIYNAHEIRSWKS